MVKPSTIAMWERGRGERRSHGKMIKLGIGLSIMITCGVLCLFVKIQDILIMIT